MRRNELSLGLLLALTAFGCKTQPEAVYVDLGKVASHLTSESMNLPLPPPGQPGTTVSLPSQPAQEVLLDTAPDVARAQRLIDLDRRRTRRSLARQYSISRNADIDDIHEQKLQEVQQKLADLREKVNEEIKQRFSQYGIQRAPLVTKITSLDAFVPFVRGSAVALDYRDRATKLRAEVNQLDLDYIQDRRNIQARVRNQNDVELGEVAKEIATLRAQADEEAGVFAEKQMKEAKHAVPTPTVQRVQLRAVPARTVTVAGSPRPPGAPALPKSKSIVSPEIRQDLISRQLQVWAATHGYRLENKPADGRDATDEFLSWIRDRQLGR